MKFNQWNLRITISFLALVSWCLGGLAQVQNFRNYNSENGLNQTFIYEISQFNKGVLCISTSEGLVTFDGSEFVTISGANGLSEDFINTHVIDEDEEVIVGHFQTGISISNSESEFANIGTEELKDLKINKISPLKTGTYLIATQGNGIFILERENNKLTKLSSFFEPLISDIEVLNEGTILVTSSSGLFKLDLNTQDSIYVKSSQMMLEDEQPIKIKPFSTEEYWIASKTGKIWMYKPNDSSAPKLVVNDSLLQGNIITDLEFKNQKNLWISTLGGGIYKLSFLDSAHTKFKFEQYTITNGLPTNNIQCLYKDHENNLWIGTYGGGLSVLPSQKFTVFNENSGLMENDVFAVTPGEQLDLWVGNGKGMNLVKLGNDASSKQYDASNGFVSDKVNTVFYDSRGLIWIGTENSGLYTYSYTKQKFELVNGLYQIPETTINYITGKNGKIYIASNLGLLIIDKLNEPAKQYNTSNGSVHNLLNQVYVTDDNVVWMAANGSGPFKLENGKFTLYKDIEGLRTYNVTSICQDHNKRIWFTTEGDGIFSFAPDKKDYTRYTVSDGLRSNYGYTLFNDSKDNLWVGHRNGLSKKLKGSQSFFQITGSNNIKTVENNRNSFYIDENDGIWFGTTKGIVRYDHTEDFINKTAPNTILTEVKVNDSPVSHEKFLKLKSGNYSVRFNFSGISFKKPDQLHYKYRLVGFEETWNEVGYKTRTANYPKLSSGEYTFQLIACNEDGVCNEIPNEFKFEIDIPIYLKWWFLLIAATLLIGAIVGIIHWRERQNRQIKQYLETTLDLRTRELKNSNSELEFANEQITHSINYARRIQSSIAPNKSELGELADKTMIFYKPRDIVSGDFYWFTKRDDYAIVVAADCTGHGVPGAMLSMIGTTLLDKLVEERNITNPAEILTALDENFNNLLRDFEEDHSTSRQRLKDGMDISIAKINFKENTIDFSSAERPLYFISKEGELTETKGSKFSIGGRIMEEKRFNLHTLDYKPGDYILMSSDGYADQFGGKRDSKFYTKNVKKKCLEVYKMDVEEQEKIFSETIEEWMKGYPQTDDMLLLAVQL